MGREGFGDAVAEDDDEEQEEREKEADSEEVGEYEVSEGGAFAVLARVFGFGGGGCGGGCGEERADPPSSPTGVGADVGGHGVL